MVPVCGCVIFMITNVLVFVAILDNKKHPYDKGYLLFVPTYVYLRICICILVVFIVCPAPVFACVMSSCCVCYSCVSFIFFHLCAFTDVLIFVSMRFTYAWFLSSAVSLDTFSILIFVVAGVALILEAIWVEGNS